MSRNYKVYLRDILQSINKIEKYTKGLTYNNFKRNDLKIDGVTRNLEIIGEAVKKIPDKIRKKYPEIDWKKIGGLRDLLIHEYFSVDIYILWDIIKNKIPELKKQIKNILGK